ncbi:class I SAM-dependent methyltransferase [Luteococcus sp.]|uniref:class I SAM-dependent methyltransferase n=1 Tax=Luteococcus sp. TaxID=1969402 RepID=UPI0037357EE6
MNEDTYTGQDMAIDWAAARAANQVMWDERAPQHEVSYGAADFAADPTQNWVEKDLAVLEPFLPGHSIRGLDVIHLQCHIGTDTLSLARAGATVTGLDFSQESLAVARRLTHDSGLDAAWVQADALEARAAVDGDFDVVFTGVGALTWLNDLHQWARQVAALLRPGGTFYIRDGHPMLYAMDESRLPLQVRNRYFANGTAQTWDDDSSYVPGVTTTRTRTYEWPHSMSEIITALLDAGLRLDLFHEDKTLDWQWGTFMKPTPDGYVMPYELRDTVPLTYTLVATKL